MPRAARVAKAVVISSGETPSGPRVIEQTGFSGERIPILCATSTTCAGPTRITTWAKIVFTEWAIAWASDMVPAFSSAKLWTIHGPFALRQRRLGIVRDGGPCQTEFSEIPCSMAAVNVKTL